VHARCYICGSNNSQNYWSTLSGSGYMCGSNNSQNYWSILSGSCYIWCMEYLLPVYAVCLRGRMFCLFPQVQSFVSNMGELFKANEECVEQKQHCPAYVVLHLSHRMLPLWMPAMEKANFKAMPPVVVVGSKLNNSRPHSSHFTHAHETYYPFLRSPRNQDVVNPDLEVVKKHHGMGRWREVYKSAHKTELGVSKEERKAVNEAAEAASYAHFPASGPKNFRYFERLSFTRCCGWEWVGTKCVFF
jgi:hypothetical protein